MGCGDAGTALLRGGVRSGLLFRSGLLISVGSVAGLAGLFGSFDLFLFFFTFRFFGFFGLVVIGAHGVDALQTIGRHDILYAAVPVKIVFQAKAFVVVVIAIVVPAVLPVEV